ncbi:MAG: redoxin family protein [Phycisphaerales bacterium]
MKHVLTGAVIGRVSMATVASVGALPAQADEPDLTRAVPMTEREGRAIGVGRYVPDRAVTLADGTETTLSALQGEVATVLVMRMAECPACMKMGPKLAELDAAYADKGVRFVYVNPTTVDTAESMLEEAEKYGFVGAYIHDEDQSFADHLGARTTTEVFVLDASRTIRYRGAVDDQIGLGFTLPEPRNTYLTDVLDAMLNGGSLETTATVTIAPGCKLAYGDVTDFPEELTYHNAIGRIINTNCVSCHRDDGVGPFALDSYAEVAGRTPMIDYVVKEGIMPPWDASPHVGEWANDFSLTDAEKQAVAAWIAAGGPEGDPADGAPPPEFASTEWTIGEPDVIYEIPDAVDVPASGVIDYVYQWVQTEGNRDRWVQAVEVINDKPGVLHHALVFVEDPRKENESDRRYFRRWNGGGEGYFAGYIPGQGPTVFDEDFGMRLKRRSWLKFQLHYTANGEAVRDKVRIGFKFADSTPENKVEISGVFTDDFVIPPNTKDVTVVAEERLRRDMMIAGFSPHMHFRGYSYKYELETPDGERTVLCEIPRYDYNWQTFYEFAEPLEVEKGSTLICTAVYDNTEDNPFNPDPSREVTFGEQTWDEMMIGYYMWWPIRKEIAPVGGIGMAP